MITVRGRLEMKKVRSKAKGSVGKVNAGVLESAIIMYCCKGKVLR